MSPRRPSTNGSGEVAGQIIEAQSGVGAVWRRCRRHVRTYGLTLRNGLPSCARMPAVGGILRSAYVGEVRGALPVRRPYTWGHEASMSGHGCDDRAAPGRCGLFFGW
jgi:hypothetical protein